MLISRADSASTIVKYGGDMLTPRTLTLTQTLASSCLAQGLTVTCEPGVLTALMGGSGAGKTTLMDVIAGRKTQGEITGNILVNGHPKDQATWSRVMGYVEQVLLMLSFKEHAFRLPVAWTVPCKECDAKW